MLFDATTGKPVLPLLFLARRHGITQSATLSADQLSERLNEVWKRDTLHQYQIQGQPPGLDDSQLLNELGLIEGVDAPASEYDGAILLGSTLMAARKRLVHLVRQHEQGCQLSMVFLSGSHRPLDANKENAEAFYDRAELLFKPEWCLPAKLPTTESGMMARIFAQSQLPSAWEARLVDTPDQPASEGKTRPAGTVDTLKMALSMGLTPGWYILVSSQPYVQRQALNAQRVLGLEFTIVPVGYHAPSTMPLATFLDELRNLLAEELLSVKRPDGSYLWSAAK